MSYQPQAGSLPDRVCQWFRINAEEELTAADIARRYDCPPSGIVTTLTSAVAAGWLSRKKGDDGVMVYMSGPKLPAQPEPNVVSAGAPARATRRPRRLPPLDPSKFDAVIGNPIPCRFSAKGTTRHDGLFAKLAKPGMSLEGLPIEYRASVTKALQVWCQRNPGRKHAIRAAFDGKTFGIWRTA